MMRTPIKKHCQIPYLTKDSILNPIDLIVYAHIKRYIRPDTLTAYPSIPTLMNDSKLGKEAVTSSIERLITAGLIGVIKKKGYSNTYAFQPLSKHFEMFSDEFIMSSLLTPIRKRDLN